MSYFQTSFRHRWCRPSQVLCSGSLFSCKPSANPSEKPYAVRTLNSQSLKGEGPIAISNDRIIRGGSKKTIGDKIDVSETWRDVDSYIEPSVVASGIHQSRSKNRTFPLAFGTHPSSHAIVLAGPDSRQLPITSDMDVRTFSTSHVDPNTFLTGYDDGYVWLFDTRVPLPVLTVDVSSEHESCSSASFVQPDGIPTIITGSIIAENISSCASCTYMDRLGYYRGYRKAKVPKHGRRNNDDECDAIAQQIRNSGEDDDMHIYDEDNDSEEEDHDDDDRRWPKTAEHAENYFGYIFDASQHRLCEYHFLAIELNSDLALDRFAFKSDANPDVLPAWGPSLAMLRM
ncbi:hypothetical protein F5I97DRAFT_1929460 [Phlebopus sp. FC_14]|nr:hypothetical protein F5I97DRAFT_1929460 [Phlebopus sp. FC_14]